ncbi:MAG: PTS glucose transporter subunit IIA [Gammaproteobacteria bacterium]|nr:PTS glucose transporter subunit IIA [Gammaproteobacteria bacterium]
MQYHSIVKFTRPELTQGVSILSPASGKLKTIEQLDWLSDAEQFSISQLGQGVAILVSSQTVLSPIKGKIIEWTPSHGKIVLQANNKLKFLIQLPVSYSRQHGLGITPHVKEGDIVNQLQPLMTFDIYKMQLIAKPIVLFFMLLDHKQFKSIDVFHRHVEAGQDTIFSLTPRKKISADVSTTKTEHNKSTP